MQRLTTRTLLASAAAVFAGVLLAQVARADSTYIYRSWTSTPDTVFAESPTIERVITKPVVLEPATTVEKVIEKPVMVERPLVIKQKDGHHLLNLKLF